MKPAEPNPDDYAAVKQLLALKRHEEPPPGYFDRLPGEVRAHIAQAQTNPEPWWRGWLSSWNLSPQLATGYAVVACCLVLGAVWVGRNSSPKAGERLATTPANVGNTNQAVSGSNAAPPGLFNTPSLQVQPAEFKK